MSRNYKDILLRQQTLAENQKSGSAPANPLRKPYTADKNKEPLLLCELMTTDKPVKLGSCEVAPNVIKKTISHVNRDIIMQVSDKVYKKRGKIHSLSAYLKTAIFQQTCEYLMLPQNEFGFEGYAEMRDFCKTYLSL